MLQARAGAMRWQQVVGLAEKRALSGIAVTAPLLADLNTIGMAGGLKLGDVLPQRSVAATLARLRVAGASDFHAGELAQRLVDAGVPASDLAKWLPSWTTTSAIPAGSGNLFIAAGRGGDLARAAWQALAGQSNLDGAAAYAAARHTAPSLDPEAAAPVTSFVAADARGEAVGCAIGMGRLFGTGKLIPGLDIYAAMPTDPATVAPMVALAGTDFVGAFTGGGGAAAPLDTAAAAWLVLAGGQVADAAIGQSRGAADQTPAKTVDRLNAVSCPGGSPTAVGSCVGAFDRRGGGYALTVDNH
jgi:gamma-glutamyltranspeptidase/glutathione hydrolase